MAHLDKAFDNFVQNCPPETSWDALVSIIEEENAYANDESLYAVHHVEDEDLTNHEELMLTGGSDPSVLYSIHSPSM